MMSNNTQLKTADLPGCSTNNEGDGGDSQSHVFCNAKLNKKEDLRTRENDKLAYVTGCNNQK